MNIFAGLVRACGAAVTAAGTASGVGRPRRRPSRRRSGPTAQEIARLDAEFHTRLAMQIEIARRDESRFTLTATELDGVDSSVDPLQVLFACDRQLRTLDAVTLIDGVLVVLWWNTDRSGATVGLQRLVADDVLPLAALERTGTAMFPDDGLTAVALSEAARRIGGPPSFRRRTERRTHLRAVTTGPAVLGVDGDGLDGDGLAAAGR
jgi:hypothetical protein